MYGTWGQKKCAPVPTVNDDVKITYVYALTHLASEYTVVDGQDRSQFGSVELQSDQKDEISGRKLLSSVSYSQN